MSDAPVFRRTRVIEARDTDALGHVNNVVWVRFIVELAEAHLLSAGFDNRRMQALGGHWIVRRQEVDYLAGALPGEEIVEETWVESLRGARSLRSSRFLRARDSTELVRARTQWAFVDASTLRPRRVPAELLAAYAVSQRA